MRACLRCFIACQIPSDMLLGGVGKVNNGNTSVPITLLTYSPSRDVNGGVPSLTIPDDVHLFTPAVSIARICAALNASCFVT